MKRSQLENKSLAEEAELLRSSLSNETKKHALLVSTFDNRVEEQVRKAEAYKEAAASMASAVEELERKLAEARVENEAQGRQLTEWRRKSKDSEERGKRLRRELTAARQLAVARNGAQVGEVVSSLPSYRQPGLLCTPRNFAQSSIFLGKIYFLVLRLPLRHF